MKVTSFKELENYLYSSVVAPLKDLRIDLDIDSPIRSNDRKVRLYIEREGIGHHSMNYQRSRARARAKMLVRIDNGLHVATAGNYDKQNHAVELFKDVFKAYNCSLVLGRLHSMLDSTTPFTKVTVKLDPSGQSFVGYNGFVDGQVVFDAVAGSGF